MELASTFGSYRLLGRLGSGSTSHVYRARREGDTAELALKILAPSVDPKERDEAEKRFHREAAILRHLQHRNVVQCRDYGQCDGYWFLAMELIEGYSLRSWIGRRPDARFLTKLGAQISDGLAAAHSQGLIHRDLKPKNVMVTTKGIAKILDFGLARPFDGAQHSVPQTLPEVTRSDVIVGTARYMSPEQVRGEVLTPASDIFCLGLGLFEVAAGVHPFEFAFVPEVLTAICSKPTPPLRRWRADLPERLAALIQTLLEKDPKARPEASTLHQQFRELSKALG